VQEIGSSELGALPSAASSKHLLDLRVAHLWIVDEHNYEGIYLKLEIKASGKLSVQYEHPLGSCQMISSSLECFICFLDVRETYTETFAKFTETPFQLRDRHPFENNHGPLRSFCLHSLTYSVDQILLTFVHFSFVVKFLPFVVLLFYVRTCWKVNHLVTCNTIGFLEEPLMLFVESCRYEYHVLGSESTVEAIHQHFVTLPLEQEVLLLEQKVCLIDDADVHVRSGHGHQLGSDHLNAFIVLLHLVQLALELHLELLGRGYDGHPSPLLLVIRSDEQCNDTFALTTSKRKGKCVAAAMHGSSCDVTLVVVVFVLHTVLAEISRFSGHLSNQRLELSIRPNHVVDVLLHC
jgi:hypothetical protein